MKTLSREEINRMVKQRAKSSSATTSGGGGSSSGGSADYATEAGHALEADHATTADTATNADTATSAAYATEAGSADSADYATAAGTAATAGNLAENSSDWAKIMRKDIAQTAAEVITFAKGIISTLKSYFRAGIEVTGGTSTDTLAASGNATIGGSLNVTGSAQAAQLIANLLKTPGFTEAVGMIGLGFGVTTDANGRATLQTDDLLVLGRMIVNSLNIREVTYIGGVYLMTPAGSRVDQVLPLYGSADTRTWTTEGSGTVAGYRLLWKADDGTTSTMNYWQQGDMAYCQTFNVTEPGEYENANNQLWWRLVCRVGQVEIDGNTYHYADVSNTRTVYLYDSNGNQLTTVDGSQYFLGIPTTGYDSVPLAQDKAVCLGSQYSASRQGAVQLSAEGRASIGIYDGIKNYLALTNYEIHYFGLDAVRMNSQRFSWNTPTGATVTPTLYMGTWTLGCVSYPGFEWSYNDSMWRYIGTGTSTEAPGTTAANWTEIKGEQGDDGITTATAFLASSDQPSAPTDTNNPPTGWMSKPQLPVTEVTRDITQSSEDSTKPGYRVFYGMNQNSLLVYDKLTFVTTEANQAITIELEASSEPTYDYIFVSAVDAPSISRPSYTAPSGTAASGTQKVMVTVIVPSAGSHYIYVGYTKDGSGNRNNDCAWYRFIPAIKTWVTTAKFQGSTLVQAWSTPVEWNAPETGLYPTIIAQNNLISMSINSGWRNFVKNPCARDAAEGVATTYATVNDAMFGSVIQVANTNDGDVQIQFDFDNDNRTLLTNKKVTLFAVVKPMTAGSMYFGTHSSTATKYALLGCTAPAADYISAVMSSESGAVTGAYSVGNGWWLVYATVNAYSTFANEVSSCGINSLNGSTWEVFAVGIAQTENCPSLYNILTNSGLRSSGINITEGQVELRADKVTFTNSDGTVSGKVSIDPTKGTLITHNAILRGNLMLPYTRITSANYLQYGSFDANGVFTFNLLGEQSGKLETGLNIQVEYAVIPTDVTSLGLVKLPVFSNPADYLGCEVNILNAAVDQNGDEITQFYVRGSLDSSYNFGLRKWQNDAWSTTDHNVRINPGCEGKFKLIYNGTNYFWICSILNQNQ